MIFKKKKYEKGELLDHAVKICLQTLRIISIWGVLFYSAKLIMGFDSDPSPLFLFVGAWASTELGMTLTKRLIAKDRSANDQSTDDDIPEG